MVYQPTLNGAFGILAPLWRRAGSLYFSISASSETDIGLAVHLH